MFQEWFGGNGVLIGRKAWVRVDSINQAIMSASTWREFQALLPEGEFESLALWCENEGEYGYREAGQLMFVPADVADDFLDNQEMVIDADDPFDSHKIPGIGDGDYPSWIDAIEETSLPEVLLEAFGVIAQSRLSGSWVEFPVDDTSEQDRFSTSLPDTPGSGGRRQGRRGHGSERQGKRRCQLDLFEAVAAEEACPEAGAVRPRINTARKPRRIEFSRSTPVREPASGRRAPGCRAVSLVRQMRRR